MLSGCWVRWAMQVPRFKGPRTTYTACAGLADAICACVNLGGVGATGACQLMLLWLDAQRACSLPGRRSDAVESIITTLEGRALEYCLC